MEKGVKGRTKKSLRRMRKVLFYADEAEKGAKGKD
jgi:hypothetical protein